MKKHKGSKTKVPKAKSTKKLTSEETDILKGLKAEEQEVLRAKKKDYEEEEISYEPTLDVGDLIEIKFEMDDLEPDSKTKDIIRGKVLGIYDDGPVPDIDENIEGTPQDPAVLLEIYTETNGKWKKTETLEAYRMSELKRAIISYKED